MTDQSLISRSTRAKRLFVISAGIGAGITLAIVAVTFAAFWYRSRPVKPGPWNRTAITAEFTGLSVEISGPLVSTFRYSAENHTGHDYELPANGSIYKILAERKGLERDGTLQWAGGRFLPAEQKINIAIQIEYPGASDTDRNDPEKLTAFMKRRLAEIEGFAALDEANRYEIRFLIPKPPDTKP